MPTYCGIPFCHSENSLGWASRQTRALLVTWAEPPTALSPWALISPLPGTKILPGTQEGSGDGDLLPPSLSQATLWSSSLLFLSTEAGPGQERAESGDAGGLEARPPVQQALEPGPR